MHPNVLLPLTSSVLSLIFAVLVFDQYLHHRKMYQLVWAVGLVLYCTSAGTEFLGGAFGWSTDLFRWWYILGAIGVAMYLGLGTIYLLGRTQFAWAAIAALVLGSLPALFGPAKPFGLACLLAAAVLAVVRWRKPAWFGHAFLAVTLLGTAYAATVIFTAPVDTSLLPTSPDQIVNGQAFPASVRILTPVFNMTGAIALSLGAAYSAYYFWRTRTKPHRMVSNVLIAVGAFIPAMTSGLSRFGLTNAFFVGELLGVVCILAGFLVSIEVFSTYRIPLVGTVLRARASPDEGA